MFMFPFSYMSQTQNLFIKKTGGHFREEAENLQLLFMHDDGQKQIVSDRSTD